MDYSKKISAELKPIVSIGDRLLRHFGHGADTCQYVYRVFLPCGVGCRGAILRHGDYRRRQAQCREVRLEAARRPGRQVRHRRGEGLD